MTVLPLSGITAVSLEQAVAAPFATRQLADLGARVVKVERPGIGDFARGCDESVHGQSSYFVWLNRNKESITLDIKRPRRSRGARPAAGRRRRVRAEPRPRGVPARMDPVPAVGEHADAILAELGYGTDEIVRLRADGCV
jgi:crotonobetainyl-CoA:carnitine CoA-transferase CaiB-like acyl-CoA transferase